MTTKGELCALAAAALAISGTSASDATTIEPPVSQSHTESECSVDLADLWPQVVAKAWSDENFKRELLADPARALKVHFNYEIPPEMQLEIVEKEPGNAAAITLTLPGKPPESENPGIEYLPC